MAIRLKSKNRKLSNTYIVLFVAFSFTLVSIWLQSSTTVFFEIDYIQQPAVVSQPNTNHTMMLQTAPPTTQSIVKRDTSPTIPRRLIFTYKTNLLTAQRPRYLYLNTMKTIRMYAEAWNISADEVDVLFLDDSQCAELIIQTEPKLVKPFQTERYGGYKADICRIAALYLYGGYYFDIDIEPIIPLKPDPGVDFITAAASSGQFFQAVLAVAPSHPLMKANLQSMLDDWYMLKSSDLTPAEFSDTVFFGDAYTKQRNQYLTSQGFNLKFNILLGPATLWMTYRRMKNHTTPWILDEIAVTQQDFPELMRPAGRGWGCNFAVVDRTNHTGYFYSRCRGTSGCPTLA